MITNCSWYCILCLFVVVGMILCPVPTKHVFFSGLRPGHSNEMYYTSQGIFRD